MLTSYFSLGDLVPRVGQNLRDRPGPHDPKAGPMVTQNHQNQAKTQTYIYEFITNLHR